MSFAAYADKYEDKQHFHNNAIKAVFSRTLDAVTVLGKDLGQLSDKSISNFRLFSKYKTVLLPIPFQIDQRDEDEKWVWDIESGADRVHDSDDPEGKYLYDANDLLVFIASDIGEKTTDFKLPAGASDVYEISVIDSVNDDIGWVYLVYYEKNPPPLSNNRYIHFDDKSGTISTQQYQFSYSDTHIAVMDKLLINNESILDRTKVRGQIELDMFLFETSITFNEEEIEGYSEGYISGPVRLITRSIAHLAMEGMDAPDVVCDHFYYPGYTELPIAIAMQFPVKKASLKVTGDYFGGQFNEVYIDGIDQPFVLSDKFETEDFLRQTKNSRWLGLSGQNKSIVLEIKTPESIRTHTKISPWLAVDTSNDYLPENVRGVNPEAGFNIETLEDIPSGHYVLHAIYKLSNNTYHNNDSKQVNDLLHKPLVHTVKKIK